MKLSTRLSIAMVGLVLFTTTAVGLLTYRDLEADILPRALRGLDRRTAQRAADLETYVSGARNDVIAHFRAPSVQSIIRAHDAGGVDPVDGTPESLWITRTAQRIAAEIEAKGYLHVRIIAITPMGGREIVRVERSAQGGKARVVPTEEFRHEIDQEFLKHVLSFEPGTVSFSKIELNKIGGIAQTPHVPMMRVATALQTASGEPFGTIDIDVDLRPAFNRFRASAAPDTSVYLVNEHGNFLIHPDRTREFGFEFGRSERLQDEFPELGLALVAAKTQARLIHDAQGERIAAATSLVPFANARRIVAAETVPHALIMGPTYTAARSIVSASILAVLVAIALAIFLSRSLSRKLEQVTAAVQAFGRGEALPAPMGAYGEVGVLSRAFDSMAKEIQTRSEKLREYRRRERFYVAAVESSSYGFITIDPDGVITAWNPGAERLFGHAADAAIGQHLSIIIPEDKREEARLNRAKIHRLERVGSLETLRLASDGRLINVMVDGSPILSKSGKLLGSSIIVRDLSAEKLAHEMFRLAVESCPSGMVMFDRSNRIVLVNAEVERMFGHEREVLLNKTVDVLVPRGLSAEDGGTTDLRPPLHGADLFGLRADGSTFPVEIRKNPIQIRDGLLVLGVIVDISERRQNERLKDEFVSTVSHELRTPLTSIAGSLGLLAGGAAGQLAEPTMRLLKIAHKNSERLVRLINDILDIEKIESGKVVFDLKRVDICGLIEQAIEGSRGYAEGFGVRVRFDAPPAAFVRADPDRFVQVITNLLSNAVKFSPRGEEVLIAIEQQAQSWRVVVRDHGIGIPDDFKPRVFEKFAQADATDARQKGGTGLGLSIVKQIVTLLGGTVNFETPAGGGTVFYVDLPRWELSDAAKAALANAVLIVDDDAAVAKAIALRLERTGFSPDAALSARDAFDRAKATTYDAVLVDLNLPDRDGISLIQDLRSEPQYHNTPIVVISAEAERGREDARATGLHVLDWLNKPIDIGHLVSVLERPLARNGSKRPRILHIDDDASVRVVVAEAVGPTCEVTSVASIADARVALMAHRFDLAVLDLVLSQSCGLDLLPELRDGDGNAIPVILYSARAANGHNAAQVQAALSKSHTSIDHLIHTLRKNLAGRHAPAQQTREVA